MTAFVIGCASMFLMGGIVGYAIGNYTGWVKGREEVFSQIRRNYQAQQNKGAE